MSADLIPYLPRELPAATDDAGLYYLAKRLGGALLEHRWRTSCAESCTGGWIAQAITAVPGSSAWFELGLVTYSNEAKRQLLGVPAAYFDGAQAPGAVSEQTVRAMAEGVLRVSHVELAVASSGIAGPDGGTAGKPVGTVWLGWGIHRSGVDMVTASQVYQVPGTREQVRRGTVALALQGLLGMAEALSDVANANTG